jgi:hypothetical protein
VVANLLSGAADLLILAWKAAGSVKGFFSVKRSFTALASLRRQRLPGSKVANLGVQRLPAPQSPRLRVWIEQSGTLHRPIRDVF